MPYQKPEAGEVIVFTYFPEWWEDEDITVGKEYLIDINEEFIDDEDDLRSYPQSEEAWDDGIAFYIIPISLEND